MFPPCQAWGTQRNLAGHSTSRGSNHGQVDTPSHLTTIPQMLFMASANRSPDNFVLAKCGMQLMPDPTPGVGQSLARMHCYTVVQC